MISLTKWQDVFSIITFKKSESIKKAKERIEQHLYSVVECRPKENYLNKIELQNKIKQTKHKRILKYQQKLISNSYFK
ncbi:hypothetical protein BpHYR1_048438 [Brachionus plicatilis]|uniref:Uncharacterized protein n=1 Tax=Brachionus plicatilis TaxID=10195 RepID=A0A3M7SS36_BRAPC|nr:hypothetical protein BpHYR1_048438 [Brachionus plicatilis]